MQDDCVLKMIVDFAGVDLGVAARSLAQVVEMCGAVGVAYFAAIRQLHAESEFSVVLSDCQSCL